MIDMLKEALIAWFKKQDYLFRPTKQIGSFSVSNYNVASQPGELLSYEWQLNCVVLVSVHILLHRALAIFMQHCVVAWQINISDLLPPMQLHQELNLYQYLIEEPLRIQVFFAQIKARYSHCIYVLIDHIKDVGEKRIFNV